MEDFCTNERSGRTALPEIALQDTPQCDRPIGSKNVNVIIFPGSPGVLERPGQLCCRDTFQ
jgi:hypothetical protein